MYDDLVREARLDAKAFRENTVYDSEGDPIRLVANAERLDAYADAIEYLQRQLAEAVALRPMTEAPKDGTFILAQLGPNDSEQIGRFEDRWFSVRHEGYTQSGYDMGWALYPGYGGVADEWFAGWLPIPAAIRERSNG